MSRGFINVGFFVGLVAMIQPLQSIAATGERVETLSLSEIQAGAASFKGQIQPAAIEFDPDGNEMPPKEALFQQYGVYTFIAFKKHPELVAAFKKLKRKFDPHTMGTSQPGSIATFNGRTLLILEGCFPHNCGGTKQIVAFEPSTKLVYLLEPTNLGPDTTPSGKFNLYGNPDIFVRSAMYTTYLE